MNNTVDINLKELFKVIKKRKIAFIIASIIILVAGLVYTFLVSPEYSSASKITLNDNELFLSNDFYNYLPEVADSLMIIPSYKDDQEITFIVDKIDIIPEELKSGYVLSNTKKAIDNNLNTQQLIKSINTVMDRWNGILTITAYANQPITAVQINENLLKYLIEFKKIKLEEVYNDAIKKIDAEIKTTEGAIEVLNSNSETTSNDAISNLDINEELQKYDSLSKIKNELLDNKEFYTDTIKIIEYPDLANVRNESNYLRNILLSLVAALFIGIIAVFTVNYFKTNKKSEK